MRYTIPLGRVLVFISLYLIGFFAIASGQDRSENPNIIIIYADDVGYGDVGAYGANLVPTPNIDQLAKEGLLFTDAYSTASTCTPSRYSLLTGEYAFRNERAEILSGEAPLLIKPGMPTLPSILQEVGYRTSVIGKWHLGLGNGNVNWNNRIKPGPLEVGFDESFIIPATTDRVPTVYVKDHFVYQLEEKDKPLLTSYQKRVGNLPTGMSHPGMLRYPADEQHSGTIVNEISRIGWMKGGESAWWKDQEMSTIFAERSKNFIKENRETPFFLFLSMYQNHVPRAPNPRFIGKSETGLRGDTITEFDWVVGEVISTLEKMDLREQTIIIFTSDNGPIYDDGYTDGAITEANGHKANGPLRGGKYHTFEGGTRLPFIISWPGQIQETQKSSAIISQVDIMASISALTGAKLENGAAPDSFNLLSALLGKSEQGRSHVVQQGPGQLAIRKGPWKFIPAGDHPSEWIEDKHNARPNPISTHQVKGDNLFNLEDDLEESTNIADKHLEIVQELADLLDQIRNSPQAVRRSVSSD